MSEEADQPGGGVTFSGLFQRAAYITTHHCGAAFHWSLCVKRTTQIIGDFIEVQEWGHSSGLFSEVTIGMPDIV